jgi:dehydrogenase/reductase SDR family protein 1
VKELDNKIALVTGASRGIGKGIALALAKSGAIVYITGRTEYKEHKTTKLSGYSF